MRTKQAYFAKLITDLGSAVKLWWKLDDASGATVADSSGNSNTGTVSGSWSFRVPVVGNIVGMGTATGSGQTIALASSATLPSAAPATLFYLWTPLVSMGGNAGLVGDATTYIGLRYASASNVGGLELVDTNAGVGTSTPGCLRIGMTHLIELSIDGPSNATVYVDGVERISATAVTNGTWNSTGFVIGSGAASSLNVQAAHVVIVNRQLTTAERANLNAAVPR
jgi:hypothetical protein